MENVKLTDSAVIADRINPCIGALLSLASMFAIDPPGSTLVFEKGRNFEKANQGVSRVWFEQWLKRIEKGRLFNFPL